MEKDGVIIYFLENSSRQDMPSVTRNCRINTIAVTVTVRKSNIASQFFLSESISTGSFFFMISCEIYSNTANWFKTVRH